MKGKKHNPRYCQQAVFIFAGWIVLWKIKKRRVKIGYKTDNSHYWDVVGYGATSKVVCWATIEASHPTQAKSRRAIASWINKV